MSVRNVLMVGHFTVAMVASGFVMQAGAQSNAPSLRTDLPKLARVELDRASQPSAPEPGTANTASAEPAIIAPTAPAAAEPAVAPLDSEPAASTASTTPAAGPVIVPPSPVIAALRQRLAKASAAATKDERLALQQLYGRDGATPLWVSDTAVNPRGLALSTEIARADDWGLKASEFELPTSKATDLSPDQLAETELKLSLAALKYARYARGGRVDPTQLSTYLDRKAQTIAPKRIMDDLGTATAPDAYLRGLHPQHPQFEKLRQAYLALRDASALAAPVIPATAASEPGPVAPGGKTAKVAKVPPAPEKGSVRKLIANMEMWRWMPTDLGATHLIVNVPEFQFRLVRNGQVLHTERVITGKTENQTPIFSDMMETVVFKPTWNVPDSIKVKELLPALTRNPGALAKQGLRVAYNGKEVDPTSINWSSTDIRALHVFQPPGDGNALGIVKFLFPNKHAVYLHDTPTKALFNASNRTFSHGCIRVRNPVRLAEVLMDADKGWNAAQVKAQLAVGAPENSHTTLTRKFPVHIAYFTAWADDAGQVEYFRDVYAYETNIHLGLEGKTHLIVKKKEENLGAIRAEVVGSLTETKRTPVNRDWMRTIFGGN